MNTEENYLELNKKSWNNRTDAHVASEFYDNESFLDGRSSLNSIELDLLGDLTGKSVLHLQCHFGQDTISLSRMGAKTLGVDFSDKAIQKAEEMAQICGSDAQFVCCDLYSLPGILSGKFDYVFTSYGTIGWLPDINNWASIVAHYLKPGGKLVFVEFHPAVWMFDDDFKELGYSYFNTGPIVEQESGTYADREAPINQTHVMWNHGMAEVLTSLINQGLEIEVMQEFDYSPYNCFKHTEEFEKGKFRIKHLGAKLPMVYAIVASKKEI